MVKELAKWKSALTNRTNDLQEVVKSLLDERKKVHGQTLKTYSSLKLIAAKLTDKEMQVDLRLGNIIEAANMNYKISECVIRSLNLPREEINKYSIPNKLLQHTPVERVALKVNSELKTLGATIW